MLLLNMPIVTENNAHFICILCVSFVLIFFNKKHKIIKNIFYLWPKYPPFILSDKIEKNNMTKNRD